MSDIPAEAVKRRRSAGRDLPAAIAVGVTFFVAVAASVTFYRPVFVALLVLLSALGAGELVRAVRLQGSHPPVAPVLAGTVAMPVIAWFEGSSGLGVAFLATAFAVIAWRLFGPVAGFVRDIATAVFIAAYVPLLASFAALLSHPHDGARLVVTYGATVVASDVGGYATGVLIGRHKMVPKISPGKTWEGFAGSIALCMAIGYLTVGLWLDQAWWKGLVFGLAAAVTATVGDLCESAIKRDIGIKDMGSVLPGHGGVMDRLDSLLPGAAVAYLLLTALT